MINIKLVGVVLLLMIMIHCVDGKPRLKREQGKRKPHGHRKGEVKGAAQFTQGGAAKRQIARDPDGNEVYASGPLKGHPKKQSVVPPGFQSLCENGIHGSDWERIVIRAQEFARNKQYQDAMVCAKDAVTLQKDNGIGWYVYAVSMASTGKLKESFEYFKKTIQVHPKFGTAYIELGRLLERANQLDDAALIYEQCIATTSRFPNCFLNLVKLYNVLRKQDDSQRVLEAMLQHFDDFGQGHHILAMMYRDKGMSEKAMESFKAAVKCEPSNPEFVNNLAIQLWDMDSKTESQQVLEKAINNGVRSKNLFSNLANVYYRAKKWVNSEQLYKLALQASSEGDATIEYHMGAVNLHLKRSDIAEKHFRNALSLNSTYMEAAYELGVILKNSKRHKEAIPHFQQVVEWNENYRDSFHQLFETNGWLCNWENYEESFDKLKSILETQLAAGDDIHPHVTPFQALLYPLTGKHSLDIGRRYANSFFKARQPYSGYPDWSGQGFRAERKKIRIGYVSDFLDNPISQTMNHVYRFHNLERFEIYCYATLPDNGKESHRQAIQSRCQHWVDISAMSDKEAAARIYNDHIDIAVDLHGYVTGARLEVLSYQPAPIQAQYQGFPGTMGAPWCKFMLVDRHIVPPEAEAIYSEKSVHLPDSYLVANHLYDHPKLLTLNRTKYTPETFGLPGDKFIFCSFNSLYKISPRIFRVWMRILHRTQNSVLWLQKYPLEAVENVKSQAVDIMMQVMAENGEQQLDRSVVAESLRKRLIFSPPFPKDIHIVVKSMGGLFLDNPVYNAHSTGLDILWAGVPVLTLPLERWASRVASSLVRAANLDPQLIVSDYKQYEERAVYFATHPDKLMAIREKWWQSRATSKLFDCQNWTQNLERGYQLMFEAKSALPNKEMHIILSGGR